MRASQGIFSFPAMLTGLLLVLSVSTVRDRFDDPDMWWHLKTGQIIWTTHQIPLTDLFSFTTDHHLRIPHEWLSQLLIYGAFRLAGFSGLMLWLCFFTFALLATGYALCSLYANNAKVGFVGALFIWFFATSGLAIRPQALGYLFLLLELLLIHLGRTRNSNWFLGLPLLFAAWVNCHASFLIGLGGGGAILVSSLVNWHFGPFLPGHWTPRCRRTLAASLALSIAALWLNPVGGKLVFYPLLVMLHRPLNLNLIEEWQPLLLTTDRGLGFLVILGILFLIMVVRRAELYWDEVLLVLLGMGLALSHRRLIFVFGILVAPILSRLLSPLWDGYHAEADRRWPNAVMMVGSLMIVVLTFPGLKNLNRQVDARSPVKVVEFIRRHHLPGNMLNEYGYGGYLIWAAPDIPVFVNGGADIADWTGVVDEYLRWTTLQSDPAGLLAKYKIDYCVLAAGSPMVRVLPLLPGWKMIYSDGTSVVFVGPHSAT